MSYCKPTTILFWHKNIKPIKNYLRPHRYLCWAHNHSSRNSSLMTSVNVGKEQVYGWLKKVFFWLAFIHFIDSFKVRLSFYVSCVPRKHTKAENSKNLFQLMFNFIHAWGEYMNSSHTTYCTRWKIDQIMWNVYRTLTFQTKCNLIKRSINYKDGVLRFSKILNVE